jgi:hypothetical protein
MMKRWDFKCLHLPKLGNSEEEYEDAFLKPDDKKDLSEIKIAIADGATESSFAKEWAQIIVKSFKKKSFEKEHLNKTISQLCKIWQKKINSRPLEWYALEKVEKGAFTAFLGLSINLTNLSWSAIAVGDCCIFIIRENELIVSFPINSSEEFGSNPYLISSNLNKNKDLDNYFLSIAGDLKFGDTIILSTDAFSAWFLKQYEDEKRPWNTIKAFVEKKKYNKGFEKWINYLRREKLIKNDDITVLIVQL